MDDDVDAPESWYVTSPGVVREWYGNGPGVDALAYPAPLLLVGIRPRTLPSTVEAGRPAAGVSGKPPVRHESLEPPWRLVLATDGLLRRLGAGREDHGKRTLLRWQSGHARDRRPASYLKTEAPIVDDETFAIVRWVGWDATFRFDLDDDRERHRVKRLVRDQVARAFGRDAAEALGLAVSEALDNVRHAYHGNGPVTVRLRNETNQCRVEVEDEGRGSIEEGAGFELMNSWADSVEIRHRYPSGTVVSLAVSGTSGTKEENDEP